MKVTIKLATVGTNTVTGAIWKAKEGAEALAAIKESIQIRLEMDYLFLNSDLQMGDHLNLFYEQVYDLKQRHGLDITVVPYITGL